MMNMENIMIALEMMWKGMVGIFAVILIITGVVVLFTKIFQDHDKKDVK